MAWAAARPAFSASSLFGRQMKVSAGSSPRSCCGARRRRLPSSSGRRPETGPGSAGGLVMPAPRMLTCSSEPAGCGRRAISRSTARPSRPKPTITTCAGRVPSGARGCLSRSTLAAVSSTEKKSRRKLRVVFGPDAPGRERRGDFRVAHLSKDAERPAVGLRYFPGAQSRRGIRGAEFGARIQDVGVPQTCGAQRDGIRRVPGYVKQAVRADLFGRGRGGADQHDLVVFGPQLPREFHRDGPVTGHDGMPRRVSRRPVAQLLAEQKTYRFHGCHCRGGGREEAGNPERHRETVPRPRPAPSSTRTAEDRKRGCPPGLGRTSASGDVTGTRPGRSNRVSAQRRRSRARPASAAAPYPGTNPQQPPDFAV